MPQPWTRRQILVGAVGVLASACASSRVAAPVEVPHRSSHALAEIEARVILCGDVLSSPSRERLLDWLRACETGKTRLRAGLPQDWIAGDKTGSGARGAVNDVAIVSPPGRAPILVASYMSDGSSELEALAAAHADVGRVIAREL